MRKNKKRISEAYEKDKFNLSRKRMLTAVHLGVGVVLLT